MKDKDEENDIRNIFVEKDSFHVLWYELPFSINIERKKKSHVAVNSFWELNFKKVLPLFYISNKTGKNINLLRDYLINLNHVFPY